MGLDVTFLNFDHTYTQQTGLLNKTDHHWIDLTDLQGVNLYCSPSALKQIKQRLQSHTNQTITFIGSGNYHYVSFLLLENIDEPFTLVLFDYHSDCQESPILSCGSWVNYAIRLLKQLQQVILLGVHPQEKAKLTISQKVPLKIYPYTTLHQSSVTWMKQIKTEAVYISIDKDVLHPSWAYTNWDQGEMSLTLLLSYLGKLAKEKHIIGLDVCGEWPYHPSGDGTSYQYLKKNEQANQAILSRAQEAISA